MAGQDSVWYRVGYTLERARITDPRRLRSLSERSAAGNVGSTSPPRPKRVHADGDPPTDEPWETVIMPAAGALAGRLLGALARRRRPGLGRLLHAGAAGAGAGVLHALVRPLLSGPGRQRPFAESAGESALRGAARGLVYGALVEPHLPGPAFVRGTLYGGLEYLLAPWGGLTNLAGRSAPHRSVPVLADLLDGDTSRDDGLVEHVLFGIALAALCGARARQDGDE